MHSYQWLRPDFGAPCSLPAVSGSSQSWWFWGFRRILLDLMRNSEKPGFSFFFVLGIGRPALRNSMVRLKVGCLCYLRSLCLFELLYDVRVSLRVVWMDGVGESSRFCHASSTTTQQPHNHTTTQTTQPTTNNPKVARAWVFECLNVLMYCSILTVLFIAPS